MGAKHVVPMDDHWKVINRVAELTGGSGGYDVRGFCDRVIECTGKQWPLDLAVYDDGLYTASTTTVVDIVESLDGTVLVIGHNPTMAGLVQHLDDGASDYLVLDYPTSAVTVLDADSLEPASARITAFFTPSRSSAG